MRERRERSPQTPTAPRAPDAVPSRPRGGEQLSSSLRAPMESRFAHNFGDVRVHDDSAAHAAASALDAAAFTTGSDIYFGVGERTTDDMAGHYLMAHELAHVVQNERASLHPGAASLRSVSALGDAAESEASAAAEAVVAGSSPHLAAAPSAVVSRATEIPAWLETIRRNAIGDVGPSPATPPFTSYGPHSDAGINKAGGITIDQGLVGFNDDWGSMDLLNHQGQWGAWEEGDSTRYGFKENVALAKAALNENYIGQQLGDPTLVVGADIGVGTANAEANLNPDRGVSIGAQANVMEGSISGGHRDPNSDIDEWGRFGMSLGGGAAFRGHWADEDKDGTRSYGFGADLGPFSFDVKSEDPVRTGMRLGGGGGLVPMLPNQNLTKATGEGLTNYWDQVYGVAQQVPDALPSGIVPGLDAVRAMGLPDISMPSVEDILSFL